MAAGDLQSFAVFYEDTYLGTVEAPDAQEAVVRLAEDKGWGVSSQMRAVPMLEAA